MQAQKNVQKFIFKLNPIMIIPAEDAVWLQDIHEWAAGDTELQAHITLLETTLNDADIIQEESTQLWQQIGANLATIDNLREQGALSPEDEKTLASAIIETLERAKEEAQLSLA